MKRSIAKLSLLLLALDEAFDYEEYKKNGFKVNKLGDYDLKLETKPEE